MSEVAQQVGNMIREARKAKGFTQRDLAEKLGTSQVAVNHYETGTRNLSIDTIQRIASALNTKFNIEIQG